jgi:3-oxoadipate enol-lactonase
MRVAANGIRFNCAVEGPEGAPWVTLAASIAADLTLWDAQVPALGEHCRVLRFDARGHGATEATEPPYTLDLLVADVRALWDALGIARSHFVGLSLGGMIGIGLALDYPGRVASAVIANSRTEATPEFRALWDERIAVAETDGMAGLVDSTARRWLTPGFIAANPDAVAKVRAMIGRCSVAGFVGAARALQGLDLLPRLGGIAVPCLFIAGGEDGACPAGGDPRGGGPRARRRIRGTVARRPHLQPRAAGRLQPRGHGLPRPPRPRGTRDQAWRGPHRMMAAPIRHTAAPMASHLSGRAPSTAHSQPSDAAM